MADPYLSSVVLLLHGEGANGAQPIDSSGISSRTLSSFNSNAGATITTSQAKAGSGSIAVNTSGGNSWLKTDSSTDFATNAAFTFEGFVLFGAGAAGKCGVLRVGNIVLSYDTTAQKFNLWETTATTGTFGSMYVPGSTFHHILLQRDASGNWQFWYDGTLDISVGTLFAAYESGAAQFAEIGTSAVGYGAMAADYDEVRFTKGVARYSGSSITVPAVPFDTPAGGSTGGAVAAKDPLFSSVMLLLHGDSAGLVDKSLTPKAIVASGNAQVSTAKFKYGDGSIAFDGTGDYLSCGVAADWGVLHAPGAKWTLEGFFSFNTFAAENALFTTSTGATNTYGLFCVVNPTTRVINLQGYRGVTSSPFLNGNFTALPNDTAWHHLAFTCDLTLASNQITLWVDGANYGSISTIQTSVAGACAQPLKIGGYSTTGTLNGNVDEFRITLNYVRYTAAFTPPTGAFSDIGPIAPTTWSPTDKGSACTLSNGNLTATGVQANGDARSAFGASSGKWYWELTSTGARYPIAGIGTAATPLSDYPGSDASGFAYYGNLAKKINNSVQTAYGSTWTAGQVVGVALDLDNHTIEFYKNGVSMGVAFTSLPSGTYYAMTGGDTSSGTSNCTANFGAAPFAYIPPAGFTAGFGAPTIAIAGNIKDSAGANAARKLFFFREDTGSLMGSVTSDATSGNFTFPTSYTGAHLGIALPAAGEALNALVLRNLLAV